MSLVFLLVMIMTGLIMMTASDGDAGYNDSDADDVDDGDDDGDDYDYDDDEYVSDWECSLSNRSLLCQPLL